MIAKRIQMWDLAEMNTFLVIPINEFNITKSTQQSLIEILINLLLLFALMAVDSIIKTLKLN